MSIFRITGVILVVFGAAMAHAADWLDDLRSTDFEKRAAAQERLAQSGEKNGAALLPELLAFYRRNEDPEVDSRLREAMKRIVLKERYGDGPGFVGIQMGIGRAFVDGEMLASVEVGEVVEGSPADEAGLEVGDQIFQVDAMRFGDGRFRGMPAPTLFANYVQLKKKGDPLEVRLVRRGKVKKVGVVLGLMPKEMEREQELRGFSPRGPSEEEKQRFFERWLAKKLK